ncbi:MAG: glycosyltransferase [Fimbriimonadaceae bacterium]
MDLQAITASYNASAFLRRTLQSAVQENLIPVLVVDDGSTDDSDGIAAGFPNVTVIRQPNAGPSVARNRGILESRADFVLFLDSDDLLRPGYRAAFEAALSQHPDADVFVCGMEVIDEEGRTITRHAPPSLVPDPYRSVLREPVPTNGIIVRRALFAKVGLFDTGLRHAEDWDLWLRLAAATNRWVRMDHQLAVYRLRSGSLSKDGERMWMGCRKVLARAWQRGNLSVPQRAAALTGAYIRKSRYCWAMGLSVPVRKAILRGQFLWPIRMVSRNPLFWVLFVTDGFSWLRRRNLPKVDKA